MTVCVHLCRGNAGRGPEAAAGWHKAGGYDWVAEQLFSQLEVDTFLLEYDDARSGGFEPLRFMPKGKTAVLGLITTKKRDLETAVIDLLSSYQIERHIRRERDEGVNRLKKEVILSPEFEALWEQIKPRTTYRVEFETDELVRRAVAALKQMEKISRDSRNVRACWKVCVSQTLTTHGFGPTPSLPAAARRRPSGLNATLKMTSFRSERVRMMSPVRASHTCTIGSITSAEAARVPSGLIARPSTRWVCLRNVSNS